MWWFNTPIQAARSAGSCWPPAAGAIRPCAQAGLWEEEARDSRSQVPLPTPRFFSSFKGNTKLLLHLTTTDRGAPAAFAPKWSSEMVASGQRGGGKRHPVIRICVVPKPHGPHCAVQSLSSPALPVLHCLWAAQVTSITGWVLPSCTAPCLVPWSSVVAQIHYTEVSPAASLGQS